MLQLFCVSVIWSEGIWLHEGELKAADFEFDACLLACQPANNKSNYAKSEYEHLTLVQQALEQEILILIVKKYNRIAFLMIQCFLDDLGLGEVQTVKNFVLVQNVLECMGSFLRIIIMQS